MKGDNARGRRESMTLMGVPKRHFALFVLLSLFAVAQVGWWVIFQIQLGKRTAEIQHQLWNAQLSTAHHYIHQHHDSIDSLQAWLPHAFPDLTFNEQGDSIVVSEAAKKSLANKTRHTTNMFIHEGTVFSLLLIGGILYLYRTLRREVMIERRQANFLAAISHELKTPITALRLYLDTLVDRDLPAPQQRELHVSMQQNLDRLQELIERLLQARAMLQVHQSDADELVDLVEESKRIVRNFHDTDPTVHRFELTFDAPDHPILVRVDPEQYRHLVGNLLENAAKYSPQGGRIRVQLQQLGKKAELSVTDDGIGFKRSERKRIFHRFYRVGNEDTRRTEGSGIGLYLVREIARHHGGRAVASSPGPGRGATFTVQLPLSKEA